MAINRSNNSRQLVEGIHAVVGMKYMLNKGESEGIYEKRKSVKDREEVVFTSSLGSGVEKPEGSSIVYDQSEEVYSETVKHKTVALGFSITEEAKEDNQYGDLGARNAEFLSDAMTNAKEYDAVRPFNEAFVASGRGEGVPLISDAHVHKGATEISNKLAIAADLSETQIENMITQIRKAQNMRGQFIGLMPKDLVVHPDNQWIAEKILETKQTLGSNNNDVNLISTKNMLNLKVLTRLSDNDAWFITTNAKDGFICFNRTKVQLKSEGDFDTGNFKYKSRERYSHYAMDWRCVYGSEGA